MTTQDKEFIAALIEGLKSEIQSIKQLFEKDFETVDRRIESLEKKDAEFRDDFRSVYPRVTTLENKVLALEEKIKQSSGTKNSVITGVLTAVIVFVATYFLSKGLG